MMARLSCVLVIVVLAGLVVVPISPSAAQQPRRGGALRVAHTGEPPTLDQHLTATLLVRDIMNNVTENLFALTTRLEPRPMLVDRWDVSGDRLTYTFRLRRGVRFHNGQELNSEDVKASLERWGRLAARGRTLFANVASVTTTDPSTVVMRLREPYAVLLVDLALPPQPAAIYPKDVIDEAGTGPLRRMIGTGPYRLVEHLPDRHVRLDRFDGYAARTEAPDGHTGRKHAYFDSIFVIPVPDAATRIAGVRSGDFHFADTVPSDEYPRLRADRALTPYIIETPSWLPVLLNHRSALTQQKKIRQAMQAALDHGPILAAAYGDRRFWRLDPGLMPKEHPLWTDSGKEHYNLNNPTRARALLQEAGYRGEPLRWLTTMEFPAFFTAAQVVKTQLERVGFTVDLQVTDWATLLSRRARADLWEVASTSFSIAPDPVFLLALTPTFAGWYERRDMTAMMALLRRHADPKVRHDIWSRMQRMWYEDVGSIKIGDFFGLHLHRRDLRGHAYVLGNIWWNAWLEGR